MTEGPSETCRAPHVALRLSPDGSVHACCVNDQVPYGRIGDGRSLFEIWHGDEVAALRDALDGADFSLGCGDCGAEYAVGQRGQTHAAAYDRYDVPTSPLAWPRRVEFALSNTCNLQCVQCNGELSSAIRAQREGRPPLRSPYGDAFFEELVEFLPHVEVAVFIGGEPFLSRECRRVWDLLIELDLRPEVHVTTNATVWDERVEHYLRALEMNVAVSIDGATAAVNDAIRVGSTHADVLANRDRLIGATQSYGADFCLNHCLMRQNWRELGSFLLQAESEGLTVHVIPVMYPASASLLTLPDGELSAVADELAREGERVRHGLIRNATAWDSSLAHLRSELDRRSGSVSAVSIRPPYDASAELPAVRTELEEWSGQDVAVIEVVDAQILAVDVPTWAQPFGMDEFVGRRTLELDERMEAVFGARRNQRERRDPSGVIWFSYDLSIGERLVPFRGAVVLPGHILSATPVALDAIFDGRTLIASDGPTTSHRR